PIYKDKATTRPTLDDILNGPDEFGLLDVQARRVSRNAPLEITNFEEISAFVDEHGRPPNQQGDLSEKLLARRLASYQGNPALHDTLNPYDRHGLLNVADAAANETTSTSTAAVSAGSDTAAPSPAVAGADSKPSDAAADIPKPSLDAEEVTSLDDIFASAEFDELDLGDDSIFDIRHVPAVSDREQPDEIA